MNVLVEHNGPVTTVVINRPERRNAINEETAAELLEAFEAFERSEESAVAVLAGAGGCFCAGWDLKEFATEGFPESYDPAGDGLEALNKLRAAAGLSAIKVAPYNINIKRKWDEEVDSS